MMFTNESFLVQTQFICISVKGAAGTAAEVGQCGMQLAKLFFSLSPL